MYNAKDIDGKWVELFEVGESRLFCSACIGEGNEPEKIKIIRGVV